MAIEKITVVGNLTADPELRYTQSGVPVANFSVATTERVFDRQTNTWKDGDTTFLRCSVWRELGEHVAQSLVKGQQVVVVGKFAMKPYTDREGAQRLSAEVTVDEIGPSLRFGTTQFTKSAPRGQDAAQAPVVAQGAPAQQAPQQYQQRPVNGGQQYAPAQQPPQQQWGGQQFQPAPQQQPAQAPQQFPQYAGAQAPAQVAAAQQDDQPF